MKFCPQCGTTLEPGSRFCQECGCDTAAYEVTEPDASPEVIDPVEKSISETTKQEEVIPVIPATERACPQCNSAMAVEERFCQECGFDTSGIKPVEAAIIQPIQPVVVEEVEEPAANIENEEISTPEAKQFCSNCGTAMIAGDAFCQDCGYNNATAEPALPIIEQASQPVIVEEAYSPETPVEKEPVQAAEVKQFCPECGASMIPGDVFCQECGSKTSAPGEGSSIPEPAKQAKKQEAAPMPPPAPVVPPVAKVTPPPPPPPHVQQPPKIYATSLNQAPTKKKKGVLFILLGLLALAVLGAGGWFAYDKFLKNPSTPIVDSTALAAQESLPLAESQIADTPSTETPTADAAKETPATAQNKPSTTKKTAPKKQATEPKKYEPDKQEPTKSTEPLKVKVKPSAVKTGRIILSIHNDNEVKSGPLFASKLKIDKAFIITKITTYHHNWGKGAQPGTISLQKRKDSKGPWQARGVAGDDGTPNGKWVCEPNERLEEGTYKIEVSDDKSWSYNGQSDKKGFVVIEGYEAD